MAEIRQRHAELSDDPEKLYQLVQDRLLPHFDLNTIARLVLGRHWSKASPEQRGRFIVAFQSMLIRSYAKALLTFKDGAFEWLPPETSPDADKAVVSSMIKHNNNQLSVQYHLRLVDDAWQVYDVTIDGISLVTNYRGTFNSAIRRSNIEDVILRLEQQAGA